MMCQYVEPHDPFQAVYGVLAVITLTSEIIPYGSCTVPNEIVGGVDAMLQQDCVE